MEVFCNIINATFDQFNASLKVLISLKKKNIHLGSWMFRTGKWKRNVLAQSDK